jgi:hypothetical protein
MNKENRVMKKGLGKKPMTPEDADLTPAPLPRMPRGESIISLRGLNSQALGLVGVLVVLMDSICNPRSMAALGRLAPGWQGQEAVFLSAASPAVGRQAITLFPRLFYNAGEQVTLDHLWKLLPWRTVVVIKAGKICCWTPRDGAGSNLQPLNMSK